jgi:two-component system LytT family response regulator
MQIRTLIVDDMRLARARVRRFLNSDEEIEIIGECESGQEAVAAIKELKPDLVFLDVQMPELDGFGVVESIGADKMPVVIFVTAFDHFALRAFEVAAIDYVLKPFDAERFAVALRRAKSSICKASESTTETRLLNLLDQLKNQPKYLKRMAIKNTGRTIFLPTDEIDWIESAGNYLEIHAGRTRHLVRETLSALEAKLDPEKFVRIHRSTIINAERIKEMHPLFNGDQEITLQNGVKVTLSRTFRENLLALLDS